MHSDRQNAQMSARAPWIEPAACASGFSRRLLFDAAEEGILILAADSGRIRDVNPALVELLGFARSEMAGKTIGELGPFKAGPPNQVMLQRLQKDGYYRCDELPLEARDGRKLVVEFVANLYQSGDKTMIQCNVRDRTERRHMEAEIRRLQAEQEQTALQHAAQWRDYRQKLQALSRRLVEAQETERRHLARELHDETGQALTALQLNLQALMESPGTNALKPRLNESLNVVERLMEQVQEISLDLRPSLLDDLGLEPALVWLTGRQAALAGLKGSVRAGALEQRLDPLIETACFRIAQEALTNVVRHARAQAVAVDLHAKEGWLHLRVRDDGAGFDVGFMREQAVRGASLGLLSMEERAALAGGGLEFKSSPGAGAEVHAWFPLRWQATQTR